MIQMTLLRKPLAKHTSRHKSAAPHRLPPKKFGFILKPSRFYFKTKPIFADLCSPFFTKLIPHALWNHPAPNGFLRPCESFASCTISLKNTWLLTSASRKQRTAKWNAVCCALKNTCLKSPTCTACRYWIWKPSRRG